MKKFLLLLLCILFAQCAKIEPDATPDFGLSEYLGTRSDAPLENTIWGHETGGDYNLYILFEKSRVNVFYGLWDCNEIQRWSPFFTDDYTISGNKILTGVSYPFFGEQVATNTMSVIRAVDGYTLDVNGNIYNFVTTDTESAYYEWMIITANIRPWE